MMLPLYKRLLSRTARKIAALQGRGLVTSTANCNASGITDAQQLFIEWNAERLGISREESARWCAVSRAALPEGHGCRSFGHFNDVAHTVPEPKWSNTDLIVRALAKRYEVSILDFGCGLAQQSRTLAEYLRDATVRVRLTLVDIPTLRQEFLLWWGRRAGIPTTFLPCTAETPIPELPECDLCQATGFFEHVHDPVAYFNRIDAKLAVGGLLITGIMDHHEDFMQMSPQLGALRMRIAGRGYETLVRDRILRKG